MLDINTIFGGAMLLMLGDFEFSLGTAAYQEFRRTAEYRWAAQDRVGRGPALQWVGAGHESVDLQGVLYPDYWGGPEQLDALREAAGLGKPQMLVDGLGYVFGHWCVERIEDRSSQFYSDGSARKIEFTLTLRRYWDDAEQRQ